MKLVLLLLLLNLFYPFCSGFWLYNCSNTNGNFTSGSIYNTNLNSVISQLSSITQNDTGTGFFNLTAGSQGTEQANLIALCRGDVDGSDCHHCLGTATQQIRQRCPNQKEAVLWRDTCMVRYSNRSIVGYFLEDPGRYDCYPINAPDPGNLWNAAVDLLRRLQPQAARGDSRLKFATGEANVSRESVKVYGLVQCTPDLSETDCFDCVSNAIRFLAIHCNRSQTATNYQPSCNVEFGVNRFYSLAALTPQESPQPPLSSASINRKGNVSWKLLIGVVSAAALVQGVVFVFWVLMGRKRRAERKDVERQFEEGEEGIESLQFEFGVVRTATDDFSEANRLGRGGFGSVYKGVLPNGQRIAVKRLAVRSSGQGEVEFKNEVMLVAKLQHRNLVRLHGFSVEDEERLLIYEFVPHASLDKFLFEETGQIQLGWDKRFKIIGGIAKGVLYLHEDSRLRVIHRDLKASNILLDAEMNPKIGDFGVARDFQIDHTHDTSRIVGTYGYMAPEYALRGSFSTKSDVYSYGVLVLEILTGKRCLKFTNGETSEHLISKVWKSWTQSTPLDVIDPVISDAGSESDIIRCMHIGLLCVQDDASNRPTMSEVNMMLRSHFFVLPTPSEPEFVMNDKTKLPLNLVKWATPSNSKLAVSMEDSDTFTELYPR